MSARRLIKWTMAPVAGLIMLAACAQEGSAVLSDEDEGASISQVDMDEADSPSLADSGEARYLRQEEFSAPFGKVVVGEFAYPDGEAGHVTSGRLDVAYLLPNGGRREFDRAVEVGSSGRVAEWDVTYKFTGTPVIYASGGFTGQGNTEGCTVLAELTPDGPRTIAVIPDYSGGISSSGEEFETKGKIGSIQSGQGFTVTYSGQDTGTLNYRWNGASFGTADEPVLSHCGFGE